MANQAAWQQGWDRGAEARDKKGRSGGGGLLGKIAGGIKGVMKKKSPKGKTADSDAVTGEMQKSTFSSYKKGGRVKKTGLALLHKGEYVVPTKHRSSKKASRKRTVTKI